MRHNVSIEIEVVNGFDSLTPAVIEKLASCMIANGPDDTNVVNRALVLVLSPGDHKAIINALNIDDRFASLSKFLISSTMDLTSQASRDAISGANTLVTTTTLNTSVNIPALHFAIIAVLRILYQICINSWVESAERAAHQRVCPFFLS